MALLPFKPRVAKTVARVDRKTQAVTASVNFEDIDLTINGEGSEVYDYEYHFVLHSATGGVSTGNIYYTLNNLTSYSRDFMYGQASSVGAVSNASEPQGALVGRNENNTYPSFTTAKITGYVGNKRHIDLLISYPSSAQNIHKTSNYTADTSTELTSIQLFSTASITITYSLIITAVPKLQYNPHAILLKHKTLSAQTADIIFGGTNDTEGVDDLDFETYNYFFISDTLGGGGTIQYDGVTTAYQVQQAYNNSGSIVSANTASTTGIKHAYRQSETFISASTGSKRISTTTRNADGLAQVQNETAVWQSDTSTTYTGLRYTGLSNTNGTVQLYAVPKGYNADMTPWDFRQTIYINGDFSAGHSFEIPSWAMFMKVDYAGYTASSLSFFNIDFNSLGVAVDRQYLYSLNASTSALFDTSSAIGLTQFDSSFNSLIALKSGANRPILAESSFSGNQILLNGSWVQNTSTTFTSAQIKASNTNTITGKLVVSFI